MYHKNNNVGVKCDQQSRVHDEEKYLVYQYVWLHYWDVSKKFVIRAQRESVAFVFGEPHKGASRKYFDGT